MSAVRRRPEHRVAGSRADATHIVTVDADYVVEVDFLTQASRALRDTRADYVQFPQAYGACATIAAGVDAELEEYFRTNARMANGSEAVLLTGTLCVISKAALEATGGWSGLTTTEDADMGVRLCRNGYGGRFIDRVVGRGYLPLSLRDLERQRHRWASGNLQTLTAHAGAIVLGHDRMGWRRRGAIVSQLTAWLNFSLIPVLLLLAGLLTGQGDAMLMALASASVVLCLSDTVIRLTSRGLRDGASADVVLAAIANRLALALTAALATFEVLAGRPMSFGVTRKSVACHARLDTLPLLSLSFCAVAILALPAAQQSRPPSKWPRSSRFCCRFRRASQPCAPLSAIENA